jgi:hypothetical protein
MSKIVVGIFIDKFCPEIGGPYFIIKETLRAIKNIIKVKLFYCDKQKFNKAKNLNNFLKKIDICHFYGGWTFFHIKTIYAALKLKKKIIIHPLGYY